MNLSVKGMLIASAVAGLVACGGADKTAPGAAAATPSAPGTAGTVKCTGLNECKAKGACGQADHACAGKNECKGKGITLVGTADDCTGKGGKTL